MPAGIIIIGVRDSGRKWSFYGFSVIKLQERAYRQQKKMVRVISFKKNII